MEARGRDRGGENLVEEDTTRGTAAEALGKTDTGGTDSLDA